MPEEAQRRMLDPHIDDHLQDPARSGATTRAASGRSCALVLLVRHVFTPGNGAAGVVVLLHGDVDHEPVGRRTVPVVLAWLEEHAVPGPDRLDRTALSLAEADTFGDEDGLPVRVR